MHLVHNSFVECSSNTDYDLPVYDGFSGLFIHKESVSGNLQIYMIEINQKKKN